MNGSFSFNRLAVVVGVVIMVALSGVAVLQVVDSLSRWGEGVDTGRVPTTLADPAGPDVEAEADRGDEPTGEAGVDDPVIVDESSTTGATPTANRSDQASPTTARSADSSTTTVASSSTTTAGITTTSPSSTTTSSTPTVTAKPTTSSSTARSSSTSSTTTSSTASTSTSSTASTSTSSTSSTPPTSKPTTTDSQPPETAPPVVPDPPDAPADPGGGAIGG